MKYTFLLISMIGLALGITSCGEESPKTFYEKMEREGLKSGERNDSLFLGLHFGMEKQQFFVHCSDLNKDTIIYMGNGGKVEHHIPTALKYSARMTFYPEFHEEIMYKVPVTFTYDGWAPWNKDYNATQLRERLKTELMDWYGGNEFFEVPHPVDTIALVKIDGNRRILLERDGGGAFVKATFTDLVVEKELKELQKKRKEEAFTGSETEE